MKCSNCGAELVGGAQFCGKCGVSANDFAVKRPKGAWLISPGYRSLFRNVALVTVAGAIIVSALFIYKYHIIDDNSLVDFPRPVRIGEKCGYIDRTGKLVIGLQFAGARSFDSGGLAPAKIDNATWGYIDRKGNWAIPPRFSWAETFSNNGLAWVRVQQSDKNGFVDRKGRLVISRKDDSNGEFARGIHFFQGLAQVSKNRRWGFIDKNGSYAIPPQFDEVGNFLESNRAPARIGRFWGVIDLSGKVIVRPQYDLLGPFVNDFAIFQQADRWGFIKNNGRIVINPQYAEVGSFTKFGLAPVKKDGKWGFVNKSGEMIISPEFDEIMYPESISSRGADDPRFWPVKIGDLWGFVDLYDTKTAIQPQFNGATPFGNTGLAAIKVGERWGFIDHTGSVVIAPQFDSPYCDNL